MSQLDAVSTTSPRIERSSFSAPETPSSLPSLQQLTQDGVPSLKDQLDTAKEMSLEPKDVLSPEALTRHNSETSETLELRKLNRDMNEAALDRVVDESSPNSAKNETALSVSSGPGVSDVQSDHSSNELMMRLLKEQAEVEQAPILTVIEEPVVVKDQTEIKVAVEKDLLNVILTTKNGITLENAPDLVTLEGWRHQLNGMLERLQSITSTDVVTRLQAMVQLRLTQVQNAIISRGHFDTRMGLLNELKQAQLPAAERLQNIKDAFSGIWLAIQEQKQAVSKLDSTDPEHRFEALRAFNLGVSMVGIDGERFEAELTSAMADLVQEIAPDKRLSHDAVASLCLLTLHSGHDPIRMLELLSEAPQWAFSDQHEAALTEAMARGVIEARHGNTPEAERRATMQWVDMLFQGAKFEASAQALALKKLLLPGLDAEVELQHQCLLASSHLFNRVLAEYSNDAPAAFKTRASSIKRAAEGVSAHSLVLTPSLVGTLSKNVRIPDFNYHLAHVALLQKHAAQRGFFDVTDTVKAQMADIENWCMTLGLDEATARYAGQLDEAIRTDSEQADPLLKRLEGASAHFIRGFEGERELTKAGRSVLGAAKMTGTSGHARRTETMFLTSASYKARSILDHFVVNLSTTEEARRRFADGSQDFALNGETVNRGIRELTLKAVDDIRSHSRIAFSLFDGNSATASHELLNGELEEALDSRLIERKEALKEAKVLKDKLSIMDNIGIMSNERMRLIDQYKALSSDIGKMKADSSSIAFSWPHKHATRKEICRQVIEIARLSKHVDELTESVKVDPQNASLLNLARQNLDRHMEALEGVHPLSLVPRSKLAGKTPSLDVVLKHMLPRAEALLYFNERVITDNGQFKTRADEALTRLKMLGDRIVHHQQYIDEGLEKLTKALGGKSIKRIQDTLAAAVLKVYAESQEAISTFSVNRPEHRDRIEAQLRDWGLDPDLRLIKLFMTLGVREMTDRQGHLRESWLNRSVEDMDHSLARETAFQGFREAGSSWLGARFKAWRAVKDMLASESRQINEGVRGLMDQASIPGSGFNYSRSRGLSVDTGTIFSPLSGDKALVTTVDLSNPLSVRFKAMHDNSLTVANLGGDSYQVMLKGGFTGSLGTTMKHKLSAGFTVPVGANAGASHAEGIVLTFSSRSDTEDFLRAFMDPESGLHPQSDNSDVGAFERFRTFKSEPGAPDAPRADGYDPLVWLKASQIRFVTDNSVSVDISAGVMHGLFSKLSLPPMLPISGTVNLTLQGGVTSSIQQNVHGEEATFTRKGRITGLESMSAGVLGDGGTKLYGSPKTTQKAMKTLDVEQRFKLITGEQGIMPGTCIEKEMPLHPMDLRVMQALFLPSGLSKRLHNDVELATEFNNLFVGLPPSARLTVHYALKPDVLNEVRQLFLSSRLAMPEERELLLKQVHARLKDADSYEADSLQVKVRKPVGVSKNWSPGLGHVQYKRETSFAQFVPVRSMKLPKPVQPDPQQ